MSIFWLSLTRKNKSLVSFLLLFIALPYSPALQKLYKKQREEWLKFGVWLSGIMALLVSAWHFFQMLKFLLVWALFWGQYPAIEGCLVLLHIKSSTLPMLLFILKGGFHFFFLIFFFLPAVIPWEVNTWSPEKYIRNEFYFTKNRTIGSHLTWLWSWRRSTVKSEGSLWMSTV